MPRQLLGTAIASNTITTTQLQTTVVNQISAGGGPRVSSLIYPGDDTAANTVGGQTVYVIGSGFAANANVYINGNAVPSISFISASNLAITTPALSAATYPVYVINPETGATAIHIPGLRVSGDPTWVTASGSLAASQDEGSAWSYTVSANSDSAVTYALAGGSSLPTGISLAANGLISGTLSSPPGTETTYNFTVVANDAENQSASRAFSVSVSSGEGVLFANNVLLIHADGANNQNNHTFLDSSNNNFTITRNGNATQGSFSPFSQTGWSVYFDGTSDAITYTGGSSLNFGTSDFTIELWVNMANTNTFSPFLRPDDTGTFPEFGYDWSTSELKFQARNGEIATVSTTAVVRNAWNHIAVSRSGTSLRLFVNGTQVGNTVTNSTNFGTTTGTIRIGGSSFSGSHNINGYLSNFRVIKGTALYTSNFTPSTTPLTAVANTELLTCQSNRFRDASNNNFTITRNGDTSIQAFSPFAPTAAYSTANVGGSAYFDGSGDWLNAGAQTAYYFGTGDFTVEAWVYGDSSNWSGGDSGGFTTIADTRNQSSSLESSTFFLGITNTGNYPYFYNGGSNVTTNANLAISVKTWNHLAWTRSSGTIKIWVNGVQGASFSDSTSFTVARLGIGSCAATGGGTNNRGNLIGYLSNFRWVKGTAVYTSAFTPPTAPLTNIANTSLLTNFTNAGIFDQTAKNILETVGDAKVSTTQYKYGTGSISVSSGNYLSMRSSSLLDFGAGDFTVECWVRPTSIAQDTFFISASGTGGFFFGVGSSSTNIGYGRVATAWDYSAAHGMTAGNWYHVAVTRSGTSIRMFVDGAQIGSTQTSSQAYNLGLTSTTIGSQGANYYFTGHIDDLRVTKGYARYTSNFTAPSSAFKDK